METTIQIGLNSLDSSFSVQKAIQLKRFLIDYYEVELKIINVVQPRKNLGKEDAAGGLLESVLLITLNSGALVGLMKALQYYLRGVGERNKELMIDVELNDGTKIKITAKNEDLELLEILNSIKLK